VQEADWFESMNMFVRRETFAEISGFDESLVTCEDYDLSLRLKKRGLLLNDNGIVAIHHGEAATVAHFFRKEMWRGKSNFRGMMSHGFVLRELPSIVAPPVHCLLALAVVLSLLSNCNELRTMAVILFVLWQSVLFFQSIRKNHARSDVVTIVQLYVLLNVYFSARGLAVFGGRNR
jgi:GT2 family glycosyltransferase